MASVIGVVIALLVLFVILVIVLLYAFKKQKLCFKGKKNHLESLIRNQSMIVPDELIKSLKKLFYFPSPKLIGISLFKKSLILNFSFQSNS